MSKVALPLSGIFSSLPSSSAGEIAGVTWIFSITFEATTGAAVTLSLKAFRVSLLLHSMVLMRVQLEPWSSELTKKISGLLFS